MRREWITFFSLPPENLLTLLLPGLFGNGVSCAYWGRFNLWETCAFVGAPRKNDLSHESANARLTLRARSSKFRAGLDSRLTRWNGLQWICGRWDWPGPRSTSKRADPRETY